MKNGMRPAGDPPPTFSRPGAPPPTHLPGSDELAPARTARQPTELWIFILESTFSPPRSPAHVRSKVVWRGARMGFGGVSAGKSIDAGTGAGDNDVTTSDRESPGLQLLPLRAAFAPTGASRFGVTSSGWRRLDESAPVAFSRPPSIPTRPACREIRGIARIGRTLPQPPRSCGHRVSPRPTTGICAHWLPSQRAQHHAMRLL